MDAMEKWILLAAQEVRDRLEYASEDWNNAFKELKDLSREKEGLERTGELI